MIEPNRDLVANNPTLLIGLICSSCGLGFTCEKELRDHQLVCRSSDKFLDQFNADSEWRDTKD
jgi:hypothetical protein